MALLALPASAATALEIEFENPLFAFEILSTKPGVTSRTQDGWHLFEQVDGKDMLAWIFPPKGHGTFPTVIKRLTFDKGGPGTSKLQSCAAVQGARAIICINSTSTSTRN